MLPFFVPTTSPPAAIAEGYCKCRVSLVKKICK
jgi:hypothetical protein